MKSRLKSDKDAQHIALYSLSLNKNHLKMEENLLQYLCIVQYSTAGALQTLPRCLANMSVSHLGD